MKKILALLIATVCLAGTTFALDFEVGAKFNLGKDLAEGQTVKGTLENLDLTSDFKFGGSAYVHASLLPFLGVQIEPTIFKSEINFANNELNTTAKYDALVLDIPVMYWSSIQIWKLAVGVGAGVNFSKDFTGMKDPFVEIKKDLSSFAIGLAAGADAKVYINKHLGVVASMRYIMDLAKKTVPVVIEIEDMSYDTGKSYDTIEIARRFLYGSVGLEFKLF